MTRKLYSYSLELTTALTEPHLRLLKEDRIREWLRVLDVEAQWKSRIYNGLVKVVGSDVDPQKCRLDRKTVSAGLVRYTLSIKSDDIEAEVGK